MTPRLLDKLAIILLCSVGFALSDNLAVPVIGLLCLLSVSSLNQLLAGRKFSFIPLLAYSCSCVFVPQLFCGLPLILYDSLREKKWWSALPLAGVLLNLSDLKPIQLICTFSFAFTAYVIYQRISTLENNVEHLRSMRDDVTEANLQLGDRNRQLAEAQDNEVHLATLKERNRIAREIHDNVGHMLTRTILQMGAIGIINKDENLKEPLESVKTTLDDAMNSIRKSVHDLHDDSIDLEASLRDAIEPLKKDFKVTFDYDVHGRISGKIKYCFIAIVKEAVNNIIKHSSGDSAVITVREHPGMCTLCVEDNGSCSETVSGSGIGLENMHDRVDQLGGVLNISADKNGFKIFVSIMKKNGEDEK